MTPFEWLSLGFVGAAPIVGWIVSVERRISRLFSLDQRVASIDSKVDMLVEHLIDKKP